MPMTCSGCGGNLDSVPAGEPCPECGKARTREVVLAAGADMSLKGGSAPTVEIIQAAIAAWRAMPPAQAHEAALRIATQTLHTSVTADAIVADRIVYTNEVFDTAAASDRVDVAVDTAPPALRRVLEDPNLRRVFDATLGGILARLGYDALKAASDVATEGVSLAFHKLLALATAGQLSMAQPVPSVAVVPFHGAPTAAQIHEQEAAPAPPLPPLVTPADEVGAPRELRAAPKPKPSPKAAKKPKGADRGGRKKGRRSR